MRLDFVEFEGFRSAREKIRFNFGSGFTVITGRNGVGKSTIIDAIDFALTGSINKYRVEKAKRGGLAEHIWWVGEGTPADHYVRLGVVDGTGQAYSLTRHRDNSTEETVPFAELLINRFAGQPITLRKLADTTILRDELISELSLDLTEQARFSAVLEAIAPVTGPDLTKKVVEVTALATDWTAEAQRQLIALQTRLSQRLEGLAESRHKAAQAPNADAALADLQHHIPDLPPDVEGRRKRAAEVLAQLRLSASIVRELRPRVQAFITQLSSDESEGLREAVATLDAGLVQVQEAIEALQTSEHTLSVRLAETEAQNSELSHLAHLVEHGEAYGLEHGHCPLCAAPRSTEEFLVAIDTSRKRLSEAGSKVAAVSAELYSLRDQLKELGRRQQIDVQKRAALIERIANSDRERSYLTDLLASHGCPSDPTDLAAIDHWLLTIQERQVRLQDALISLDTSDFAGRIGTLEKEVEALRNHIDITSGELGRREVVSDLAKKIDGLAKAFPNEILAEQFDAVMPLLKEFYRRLRPHTDWDEIEYDFGGRIRASLNFYVADGRNPQFLFSSGQRRATGLAFLLAVHLSRHWSELKALVLDDPVQHIDDYRALNLVEVLAAIRRTNHQVIVAVEDASLARLLARRLRGSQEQTGAFYEIGTSPSGSTCIKENLQLAPLPLSALKETQAS